jgi:hypothetical protein
MISLSANTEDKTPVYSKLIHFVAINKLKNSLRNVSNTSNISRISGRLFLPIKGYSAISRKIKTGSNIFKLR